MASPASAQGSQASIASTATKAPTEHFKEPSLETLVNLLLASKRSLSSINTVWCANKIVTSARHSLEESMILSAHTGFLHKNIIDSTNILHRICTGVEEVYQDREVDFQTTLKNLDDADMQLKKTMDMLKTTIVESSLRPEGEEPKNLMDFVDLQGVDLTRTVLKESIDLTQAAQAEFLTTIETFTTSLCTIKETLTPYDNNALTLLPNLLHTLESNAAEMANLLESLVLHFDLCVNAIKHTEGGLAAVYDIASTLPEGADVTAALESSAAGLVPIVSAKRAEMLHVLTHDAQQVDDVVLELHELLADMEDTFATLQSHLSSLQQSFKSAQKAFSLLSTLQATLPRFIGATATFQSRWTNEKDFIACQMMQLLGFHDFYDAYLASYEACLIEVARRAEVEHRKEAVLSRAVKEIKRLEHEDIDVRDAFWHANMESLPADLWVGVAGRGKRWRFVEVLGEEEAEAEAEAEAEGEGEGDHEEAETPGGLGSGSGASC